MARLAKSQCMQSTRTFDNLGFNAFSAVPVSAGRGQLLQPLEQKALRPHAQCMHDGDAAGETVGLLKVNGQMKSLPFTRVVAILVDTKIQDPKP